MKSKRIVIFLIVLIALLFTFIFVLLISNKTFFKNVYGQHIVVLRFCIISVAFSCGEYFAADL